MFRDLLLSIKRLYSQPTFTAFAILAVALGAGVPTAVYAAVRMLLWPPLDIPAPETVTVVVAAEPSRRHWRQALSFDVYAEIRRSLTPGLMVAATFPQRVSVSQLGSSPSAVGLEAVSGEYFDVLDVPAAAGRLLTGDDEQQSLEVAVLSERLATQIFKSPQSAIGETIGIGRLPFVVVGVTPRRLEHVRLGHLIGTEAWIPISTRRRLTSTSGIAEVHTSGTERVTVLIKSSGRDAAKTGSILTSLDLSALRQTSDLSTQFTLSAKGLEEALAEERGNSGLIGMIFVILVSLVLLLAIGSVANLMLSRFAQRRSEFAVRRALGASTWQLVRLMLSEALVIGLAGACLALGVARVAATLLTSELPITRGRVIEIRPELDASALLAISGAIVIAVLAFGLWPAVLTIRRERGLHLQHEIAKAQAGRRPTFDWLIRWQAVIATVFCLAAWACTEGVLSGIRRDSGMLIERLAIINLTSSERRADGSLSLGEERLVALRKAVADAPGVSAGSLALGLPFGINAPMVTISASVPGEAIKRSVQGIQIAAAEGFFDTTGIGILHGRGITDMDTARESSVAVLSESTAKELFGNTVANGRELHVKVAGSSESEAVTVIGIAKDTDVVRFAARKGAVIYRSLLQVRPPRSITVVARGKTDDVSSTLAAVEMVLNRIDVGLVIEGAGPGLLMLAGSLVLLRLLGILAMTLSVVAVLVAMAGLYGVISQQVASRRKEMATRYSLGAVPWRIRRLVLVEGVSPVAQGVLVGLLFGMALRAILRLILDVPVAVLDPVQSVGLAILLTSIAAIACYLPAYRASTVEPAVLLRAE